MRAPRYVPSANLELGDLLGLLDADLLDVLAGTDHSDEILDLLELLRHIDYLLRYEIDAEGEKRQKNGSVFLNQLFLFNTRSLAYLVRPRCCLRSIHCNNSRIRKNTAPGPQLSNIRNVHFPSTYYPPMTSMRAFFGTKYQNDEVSSDFQAEESCHVQSL